MKYSLLDIVQDVLEGLDGDEVNSIDDNVESRQVATHAKHAYNRIAEKANIPEEYKLFTLTASGDSSLPVLMYRPDTIRTISWIKYNKETEDDTRNNWVRLNPVSLEDFLNRSHALNIAEDTVDSMMVTVENNTVEVLYRNDVSPDYYTTIDDQIILFNSVDTEVDTTLQASKTLCYGAVENDFQMTNGFTPAFDDHYHQLWFEETSIRCAIKMKEMDDVDAQRWARRLWNALQIKKHGVYLGTYNVNNYGRKV